MRASIKTPVICSILNFSLFGATQYATRSLAGFHTTHLIVLGFIAAIVTTVICLRLVRDASRYLHLWGILIALIAGYFIKLGLFGYFSEASEATIYALAGPLTLEALGKPDVVVETYELMTFSLISLAFAVVVATRRKDAQRALASTPQPPSLRPAIVISLLALTVTAFVFFTYLQFEYVLEPLRTGGEPIGYRIPGILQAVLRVAIPLCFLFLIFAAETSRMPKTVWLTFALYFASGLVTGLLTTSRSSVAIVLVTVAVLWIYSRRLSREKILILIITSILAIAFMGQLTDMRNLRSVTAMAPLEAARSVLSGEEQLGAEVDEMSVRYIGLFSRFVGVDSLLSIVDYAPEPSQDRLVQIFTGSRSVDAIYGQDILRLSIDDLTGTAFAPSLLGALLIVTGSVTATILLIAVYAWFWHLVFTFVFDSKLYLRPPVLALLLVTIVFYSSEGSIESIPLNLSLLFVAVSFGEFLLRAATGTSQSRRTATAVKSVPR